MAINGDEQQNAALSWTKALTKNKEVVAENSNRLIPKGSKLNLKNPPGIKRKLSAWKGRTDRQAFWLQHNLIKKTLPGEAGEIFDELKMARAEILGSEEYSGAKLNIQNFSCDITKNLADDEIQLPTLINLWFKNLNGFKLEKEQKRLIDQIPNINSRNAQKISEDMISKMKNEESFLKSSLSLLNALKLLEHEKSDEHEENEKFDEQSNENEESLSDDMSEIESDEEPNNEIDLMQSLVDEIPDDQEILQEAEVSIDEELEANIDFDVNQIGKESSDYSIFTTKYDEIISAAELSNLKEINRLRIQLDKLIQPHLQTIGKLANRLQRLLLAKQNRSWKFDLDEGVLDTSKLTRIITDSNKPLSFKEEKQSDFKDTVISILIDCSGSMRGRSINLAAVCAEIIGTTLERCSVKTEVLGYTTKHWKGGDSRKSWLQRGGFSYPGRLNDLRHIIFKSGEDSWRKSRKSLGVILKDGLLKENIDGEALQWANKRLQKRFEDRKIMIVISDGAPVDDSSLSANNPHYLENHLREVIADIYEKNQIELLAIGIGHDVTKYYNHAITISNADRLGETLLEELTELFE
tara:strand:+ start:900 stop:2642 length:1743 start_codon:yes stop_codon:yes gene_type:complete